MARDAGSEVRLPETLGSRYRLERRLGRGGMASVHLATDLRTNAPCAVKILHPHLAADPSQRRRFAREAEVMGSLEHPNIVSVLDQGEEAGLPFLVMELFQESLSTVLDRTGPLAELRSVQIMDGVLRGLQAAHEHGIVHRDLKPSNVMLGLDGAPRIADFGVARLASEPAETGGARLGSASYRAPEQAADPRSVDARADLYSAGALLYALLTCKRPAGLHRDDLSSERLQVVSEGLREIVYRATRADPADRYLSAAEMRAALLDEFVSIEGGGLGHPGLLPITSPTRPLVVRLREAPRSTIPIVLGLLLMCAGLGFALGGFGVLLFGGASP